LTPAITPRMPSNVRRCLVHVDYRARLDLDGGRYDVHVRQFIVVPSRVLVAWSASVEQMISGKRNGTKSKVGVNWCEVLRVN